jgi:hypothetical protein
MTLAYAPAPIAPAPVEIAADDRCSGRIAWYQVTAGGRVNGEFVMATFNAGVADGGFFGHGLRDRLVVFAATLHPSLDVLDFAPLSRPPIA